jgi:CDP-glycerol glycerophosphotransferase (TagB/SpsB family)
MNNYDQHVIDFINSDRFDVVAYVDKFITDYNRACYESGNADKQV